MSCPLSVYRAQINILIGFVVLAWALAPAAYYTNLWGSKAMPIVSNRVFTADGYFYNVSAVLDSRLRLNETAYKNYGMLFGVENTALLDFIINYHL
jgi:hypothetical protein